MLGSITQFSFQISWVLIHVYDVPILLGLFFYSHVKTVKSRGLIYHKVHSVCSVL